MRLLFFAAIFAISAALLSSCNSGTNNQNTSEGNNSVSISLDSFVALFPKVTLPAGFPSEQAFSGKQIDRSIIDHFFANSSYKPAFGEEKDVPDLAENAQTAKYFAEGIFQTDGYTALIIKKTDEDTYYYLSTFDADGKFIDGTCIAFLIGSETERKGSVNDDYSIQIRQADKTAEGTETQENTFLEISDDGHIKPLGDESAKIPV